MHYAELPAVPPLDSIVRCFWFLRGPARDDEPQVVVTDGRLEIILHLGNPFSRVDSDGVARPQPRAIISGQITKPLHLHGNGETDIVGIRFRTSAASAVLRLPLAQLTDHVDSLRHVAPKLADGLFAAAAGCTGDEARAAALSAVLSKFVVRAPDAMTTAAMRTLDAPGAPGVGKIADCFGMSSRTLERKILDASGLSPVGLRRVLRFRRVFRMLDSAPAGTWAQVAAEAGYYDQAHLIRDFRQFAGAPPSEFFRAEPELARAILSEEHAR